MDIKELKKVLLITDEIVIDECEDFNIYGKKGKLYVDGDGSYGPWFYLMLHHNDKRKTVKLSFMFSWQGGLVFRLDRLPTSEEAAIIRKLGGFTKKRELTKESSKKLIEQTEKHRFINGPG